MVQRSDWLNKLAGLRKNEAELRLTAPLNQGTRGSSGAFLGLADDNERYWIKPLNNLQGPRVPATEQIVGRAGALIGAPICLVRTIAIPAELTGYEFRAGRTLEPGVAHASRHIADAADVGGLDLRNEDDNAKRHAYMIALFDWCWGGDAQGLVVLSDQSRYYSHDHGWYLPPNGPNWDIANLEAAVDTPHDLATTNDGITAAFINEIVQKLLAITHSEICGILAAIPTAWPIADEELECVGFFLAHRAPAVAARLAERLRGSP
jgi:hypothetical protein